ncbi:MAG: class I SAM-dependent rRNA methyltransferase [Verrucomicrobiota bacterium]
MITIRIKPRDARKRPLRHPWVFEGELAGNIPNGGVDGEVVLCRDQRGHLLGSGFFNSKSKLIWRRCAPGKVEFTRDTLKARLLQAFKLRQGFHMSGRRQVLRLVWSDSDHLPGLIIDRYGSWLVIQTLTLGIDRWLNDIVEICKAELKPDRILCRNDAPVREKEGLSREMDVLLGNAEPSGQWVDVYGIRMWMDWKAGHKTGLYLDQVEQYGKVAAWAEGRRVLDTFSNEGGFGLACARAGAAAVTCVDSSGTALQVAAKNAAENGLSVNIEEANVFDYFSASRSAAWDLIILDPPPFAPNKRSLTGALRGYKELNLRAFQSLTDGGILATYTCSHHVGHEMLLQVLLDAAMDAGVEVRILESCFQPADHPVILGFPESEYLRGYLLEVRK